MSTSNTKTNFRNTFIWGSISPHFTKEEILSPDTIRHPHLINVGSLMKLNALREYLGVSLLVNFNGHTRRGVRSPREQMELLGEVPGAAQMSMHVQGRAFDISSKYATLEQIRDAALKVGFTFTLMYSTFVHCDDRDGVA